VLDKVFYLLNNSFGKSLILLNNREAIRLLLFFLLPMLTDIEINQNHKKTPIKEIAEEL
jgi:hypothetical protein